MGSIILCHKKKARVPYEISRIHRRIYTIEELCYYMCNHLYLVDYTIVNEQLCVWLRDELGLDILVNDLLQLLESQSSVEQFVLTILSYSCIYTSAELNHIQSVLDKLKNQKPIEKQKYKADNLMKSGAIKQAIIIYQSILHEEKDDSMDKKFYGKVYGSLGAAYGRLFLYEEAAKMYETAFQICEEESMLKAYIYACYQYMSPEEYKSLLRQSQIYQGIDLWIQEEIVAVNRKVKVTLSEDSLERWKENYRLMGTSER